MRSRGRALGDEQQQLEMRPVAATLFLLILTFSSTRGGQWIEGSMPQSMCSGGVAQVAGIEGCQQMCEARPGCSGILYDAPSSQCQMMLDDAATPKHQCASDENNHQNKFNRLTHLINDRFDFLDRHINLNQSDRRHKLQQL